MQTSIHYPPIHRFQYYRRHLPPQPHLPVTENIAPRVVTLPLYPDITQGQIEYVVASIKEWQMQAK